MKSFVPPPIDKAWLVANLRDTFPKQKMANHDLLEELAVAYLNWWRLMLTYPERRIVGPVPLWYVRRVHARQLDRFFFDCLSYLGKILDEKSVWRGATDFRGTHDTARSLSELFDRHQLVWEPILRTAKNQKENVVVRIN